MSSPAGSGVPTLDERVPCPACGERIAPFASQCRWCEEFLLPAGRARELAELRASLLLGVSSGCGLLLLLIVVAGVAAAAAFPTLQRLRRRDHERSAVQALRAVAAAQVRYHQGAEGPGPAVYGDLSALGRTRLLDRDLASGLKEGYQFEVAASDVAPGERWIAIASPQLEGRTGERWFAVNHSGAVYALGRPFPLDSQTCEVPADAVPLGEGEWE